MTIVEKRPFNDIPAQVNQTFLENGDALMSLAVRTAEVDRVVTEAAYSILLADSGAPFGSGIALLAVGGYGRRHLFPYSDVDLLLLFESERLMADSKGRISPFLQHLWDAGLRVSHSVRTVAECTEVHEQNTELNISLLDQRYLAGDRKLYAGLADRLPRFLGANRDALMRNLARLTRERHAKFADTFYHLEPNVKETPGSLRDFQLLCWFEQLRGAPDGSQSPELQDGFNFLARLRCHLHCQSGRDHNILTFDAQDALATSGDAAGLMRTYYRHARAIHRDATRVLDSYETQSSRLLAQFRDWRSRLSNSEFSVHRERAHFRAPQLMDTEPGTVLRLFEFVGRHGIRPSFEAEQQIAARLGRLREYFAAPPPIWPTLNDIFSLPHAPLAVRAMHDTGVLAAVFPELDAIECLVIRDFFHRYTVDEHTLVAIQNLWAVQGAYADLLAEITWPGVLLFALVFHDAGKGWPDEGHVDASLRLAEGAMRRIAMPEADRQTVSFLIGCHLALSAAMQSRDVFDPQTIHAVAAQVETVERLKALTLLTYADVSAVNPTVMTPWRAEQLWQFYLMIYNELTRELETDRIEGLPAGPPERREFLKGFPMRYLRTRTDEEIAAHMALEQRSRARGVAVEIHQLDSAWQLTLVAGDRAGLFASVAGALSSFGLNILRAEAFANRRGLILDTFTFADPLRNLELNPSEVDRLRTTLERVLAGKTDVKALLKDRPKPVPPSRKARIHARVSFNAEASATATLIEIVAEDRPGLLYDMASAISSNGGNIEVVLIDTQAHKAIDVFYVTAGGHKLDARTEQAMGEALRHACQPA
jgi:[protein-PII] uridylyltransferase